MLSNFTLGTEFSLGFQFKWEKKEATPHENIVARSLLRCALNKILHRMMIWGIRWYNVRVLCEILNSQSVSLPRWQIHFNTQPFTASVATVLPCWAEIPKDGSTDLTIGCGYVIMIPYSNANIIDNKLSPGREKWFVRGEVAKATKSPTRVPDHLLELIIEWLDKGGWKLYHYKVIIIKFFTS